MFFDDIFDWFFWLNNDAQIAVSAEGIKELFRDIPVFSKDFGATDFAAIMKIVSYKNVIITIDVPSVFMISAKTLNEFCNYCFSSQIGSPKIRISLSYLYMPGCLGRKSPL